MMVIGGEAFGKWVGHEFGALMNGINTLIGEILQSYLAASTMWGYTEKSDIQKTFNSAGPLILDFHSLQLWERNFCFYKLLSLWYFVIAAPVD